MSGPKLGRPPKDKVLYAQQCRDERREAGERNEVEGKFGTGKRCYGLDRLTARLQATCETQIQMIVLMMNLWKRLKCFLRQFCRLVMDEICRFLYSGTSGFCKGPRKSADLLTLRFLN
jgi:hypothetical protein